NGNTAPACYRRDHAAIQPVARDATPRLAPAPPAHPGTSRARVRDLTAAPLLRRDRARPAEPPAGPPSLRGARGSAPGAERAARGRRLCPDVSGAWSRRCGARGGAPRDRSRAGGAEAVPRLRPRPALERRRLKPRAAGALRGRAAGAAHGAGERA